jgi:D-alanyl-D-alanine carboxypeptidase/D-alanyl-D-alanine-endopeptidase (penicillin-binding protein 4)
MQKKVRAGLILLFLVVVSFSLEAKERKPDRKETLNALKSEVEKIVGESAPDVHLGVEVVSLTTGRTVYQKLANHLFVPASSLKMLTGAAALHELGVDFRFVTKLWTDGVIANKTLRGNLYLEGSGDPELAFEDLEELTFQLKLLDIQQIEGNLYADNSLFDGVSQGPGWMWDEGAIYWNSPMDALTLNHSCVDVWVKPAEKSGKAPIVYIHPKTDYVTLHNQAVTAAEVNTLTVERRWLQKENTIDVQGEIPLGSEPLYIKVPLEEPHLFAVHVFRDILVRAGFSVKGTIEARATPAAATLLASHKSRPLALIVATMMKKSDNLAADCLFKKLGEARFEAPGTWQKGAKAMREFLSTEVGLDVQKIVVLDGSGLSRYNLLSPHHFVEFLSWMHTQFDCSNEFAAGLPISGINGSLKERMAEEDLRGRVRAKTGSMSGISSLCGYLTTNQGETFAFSILQNGFTGKKNNSSTLIEDQICNALVNITEKR